MNVVRKVDTFNFFEPRLLSPTIGAELIGIDLREDLSDDAILEVRRALLDYKVVFFRDQKITREQHIAFAHDIE